MSGETRASGVPAFEDKLRQRAVLMLLEPIDVQDFPDCSYGSHLGVFPHQAIEARCQRTMDLRGGAIPGREDNSTSLFWYDTPVVDVAGAFLTVRESDL